MQGLVKGIPCILVEFESRRKYQSDVKAISVESALRMTYRDARDEINRFTSAPSHQTIWKYVQELGEKVERELSASIYFAEDSTKLHSWNGKIELTVFEGENIVVRVNREERMRTEEELNGLIALGDADRKLKAEERQIDLIHVWREVNYKLWQHNVDLETRKRYVNEVKGILLRLKNSLGNLTEERIRKAEKALNEFVEEMESKGYWRVSKFFERHMKNILLFAYKRLEGISIPWHNNRMERLMGEIAKRMKNKWMKWSERGAENLGNLLMKMRFERPSYESFIGEIMKLDRDIWWEVNLHL